MIFKNKDANISSLFGEKPQPKESKPIDPAILESFFRKQSSKPVGNDNGGLIAKSILRSSSSQDANVPGETFVGKNSARSIFSPQSTPIEKTTDRLVSRSSDFLPNVKQKVPTDIADDLMKFKGNFSEASKSAGSHGSVRTDRISMFDNGNFDRLQESKTEEKAAKVVEEKKISKAMRATDIVDSMWSKLADDTSTKSKMSRERAIDKLFGDNNA
jgi:hypothetical protein